MSALLSTILLAASLLVSRCGPSEVDHEAGSRDTCPVSIPNAMAPPGVEPMPNYHGNGTIFVAVPEDGIERALHDPRGYGGYDKLIFYRQPIGAEFAATVLPFGDWQSTEPAELIPSPGQEQFIYQVFGVWFPTEGCWEITGRTTQSTLTIFVDVAFVDPAIEAPSATSTASG